MSQVPESEICSCDETYRVIGLIQRDASMESEYLYFSGDFMSEDFFGNYSDLPIEEMASSSKLTVIFLSIFMSIGK